MKKKYIIFILLIFSIILSGCSPAPKAEEHISYVYAMDTVMTLTAYGDESVETALGNVSGAIESFDNLISVTDENSEIYKLNANSDVPATLSDGTAEIISRALELCKSTNGTLDISIYPVIRSWGFTTGIYQVPDYNDLMNLLSKVDYSKIELVGNTISLSPGMQIDLGSVAKGYVGDLAAKILTDAGVESAILNLGGNVRAIGNNTAGKPWRVGVQDPLNESEYFGVVSVTDKSVITSGGYNRYFEENGKTYWHIIDPYTGYPADNGIISATIIGDDGEKCDGLSTATFIMGVNGAFDYWRRTGGFDMLLVTKNGHIYITPGIKDSFELLPAYSSKYTVEVVH